MEHELEICKAAMYTSQLKEQKKTERSISLFSLHFPDNRLQEVTSKLQAKNVQLQVDIERLREDGHTHHDGG